MITVQLGPGSEEKKEELVLKGDIQIINEYLQALAVFTNNWYVQRNQLKQAEPKRCGSCGD